MKTVPGTAVTLATYGFTRRQLDNWGCQYTRIEVKRKPSWDLLIDDKTKRIEEI